VAVYARTTTVRGNPQALEEGITRVRDEVMPALEQMDGCVGLSMLVDRDYGTCIVTTAWRDQDALSASREHVRTLRARATEALRGDDEPEVREWEIAVLHRAQPARDGACARVTWLQVEPAKAERQLDIYRSSVLPRLEALPGFCSASMLIDRERGRAAGALIFDSRDALERTRETAKEIRTEATRETGAQILDVAEFEVALAHLRVPEKV
jgi:quinol monooxygenase YgiN